MLDIDVQEPILDKVNGCPEAWMEMRGPSHHSVPQEPHADDELLQEPHGVKWGCSRGRLWTSTSTKLHYSPDGYDKKALSMQMLWYRSTERWGMLWTLGDRWRLMRLKDK
ncbi:hypothetical protein N7517_006328 [Penicillium concentricum]|uniref:Uncharacterized protein n=1 Tax=Penicillium concentricum TaxID=293559 RepID=A0A9W9VA10_9EURO|nr:uncharacterized protein N7517_006328 [Penicillium concentricum]KAJ5374322.1 hypothetical protein N7517_006328 [Penicillium concentricum]